MARMETVLWVDNCKGEVVVDCQAGRLVRTDYLDDPSPAHCADIEIEEVRISLFAHSERNLLDFLSNLYHTVSDAYHEYHAILQARLRLRKEKADEPTQTSP